jgi:hypothetical protein
VDPEGFRPQHQVVDPECGSQIQRQEKKLSSDRAVQNLPLFSYLHLEFLLVLHPVEVEMHGALVRAKVGKVLRGLHTFSYLYPHFLLVLHPIKVEMQGALMRAKVGKVLT